MPLVYLPDIEALFLWGADSTPRAEPALAERGEPWATTPMTPEGRREVQGLRLPLFDAMATLAVVPAADLEALPASVAVWALASKLAMELTARERVVPTITRHGGRIEARWAAALSASEDAARVVALARSSRRSTGRSPRSTRHRTSRTRPDPIRPVDDGAALGLHRPLQRSFSTARRRLARARRSWLVDRLACSRRGSAAAPSSCSISLAAIACASWLPRASTTSLIRRASVR